MISNANARYGFLLFIIGLITAVVIYAQHQHNQDASKQQSRMDEMMKRGNKVMGFDQMKTTHHFILASDGGAIQVEANDPSDQQSRDEVRQHLKHIAMMFSEGNFNAPMLIHDQTPPGTKVMKELKSEISYAYKEIERGAAIRISTSNTTALSAIHDFLRFQIKEHQTGDPLQVPKP